MFVVYNMKPGWAPLNSSTCLADKCPLDLLRHVIHSTLELAAIICSVVNVLM